MTDKSLLRKTFRDTRHHIPIAYRHQAAIAAAHHLMQQPIFIQSQHIACYLFTKDEFDATPIIKAIWQTKKNCFLPTLSQENERSLHFVRYQYGDELALNQYSILEPINTACILAPEKLDLVIAPLVAFDRKGHRLGAGGGYYDRTFAFLYSSEYRNPYMLGLAYAAQEADQLPTDPWDITLDGILTEKEVIHIKNKRS